MKRLSVVGCAAVLALAGASVAHAQETGFRATLARPEGATLSDKVDGVVTAAVAAPADGAVTVEVFVDAALEPCASDPTACDGTENFIMADPNTNIPFGFGCSDGMDNDMDGMTDTMDPDCQGVQGWSLSVETGDCFGIATATSAGTDGDLVILGGLRDLQSFEKTEVVDPTRNNGQAGAVSALVLSLSNPVILPQVGASKVLILTGAMDPASTDPCPVSVVDPTLEGLRGSGEPVKTAITVAGATRVPEVCNLAITFGEIIDPPVVEDCATPGDEDGNGMADCDDPACADDAVNCPPPPPAEDCSTAEDEDGDGLGMCDDPDCATDEVNCPPDAPAEDCAAAGDEDGDGLENCDDPDCAADAACVVDPPAGDFPPAGSESGFSIVIEGGTASPKAGDAVPFSIGAAGDVTAKVILHTAIEVCVNDPTACDATENFVIADPNTNIPTGFGCSDGMDNDMDGVTDTEDPDCKGVQGWSFSVATDDCFNIAGATSAGTIGDLVILGGIRDLQSFEKSEVVDPTRNNGQAGAVSALVLSLANPIILPQVAASEVLILTGNVAADAANCRLEVVAPDGEGLRGSGEPVATAVTFAGMTITPAICNATVTVGDVVPPDPEVCDDGADNDGDGAVDCDDSDCAGTAACPVDMPEVCDDGADNDGDGAVDCDDSDCEGNAACPVAGPSFIRGNANDDSKVNIADPVWIISELFRMGPAAVCKSASDANDDGQVDQTDAMYLIMYNFEMGPPPPAPFGDCGSDGTADALECDGAAITSCPQA